jgi:hypothetical protein
LLEGALSRAAAARRVAQITALATAPAIVMVTEETGKSSWKGVSTVEKWTPLEDLVGEIELLSLRRRPPALERAHL